MDGRSLINKKFKTSTNYKVEVFNISESGDILSCYELDDNWNRIPEKKLLGNDFKVCIINKDKIL